MLLYVAIVSVNVDELESIDMIQKIRKVEVTVWRRPDKLAPSSSGATTSTLSFLGHMFNSLFASSSRN
jgi:hypothetical protein